MPVILQVRCLCGEVLSIDSAVSGPRISCPRCGRPHVVPSAVGERSNSRRMAIAGSVVGVLLICATLAWAFLASDGGGGGGADSGIGPGAGNSGDDPWAGRRTRGSGTGEGEDSGAGDPGGSTTDAAANPQTVATTLPGTTGEEPTTPPPPIDTLMDPNQVETPPPPPPRQTPVTTPPVTPGGGKPSGVRGNRGTAQQMGASRESEAAVDLGLEWLAKVQQEDGHWTPEGRREGGGQHETGVSGLAVLAFLGAGHTHLDAKSRYQSNVKKALDWLLRRQDWKGRFQHQTFYEQGIAAMAVCEAFGMTKSQDGSLRGPAQRAVEHVVSQMGPDGGYGYGGRGDDVHVTSFQVMAIKSARLAGLEVPKTAVPKLKEYYDRALGRDGTTGYTSGSGSGGRTSARTALGLFCRILLDVSTKDPDVVKVADLMAGVGPQLSDQYQTYYGTYGMFQMQGDYWPAWNGKFRDQVVAMQIKEGLDRGSWEPRGWTAGGRVCTTAMYIMALEVYYRYLPVNR